MRLIWTQNLKRMTIGVYKCKTYIFILLGIATLRISIKKGSVCDY